MSRIHHGHLRQVPLPQQPQARKDEKIDAEAGKGDGQIVHKRHLAILYTTGIPKNRGFVKRNILKEIKIALGVKTCYNKILERGDYH